MEIDPLHMGKILKEEFMDPNGLSAEQLADGINLPDYRIKDVLYGFDGINADMSIRLGIFFGKDDSYFLNRSNDVDMRRCKRDGSQAYSEIKPFKRTAKQ